MLTAATIEDRLADIDRDLEARVGALESAARAWFIAKREREHSRALVFIAAEGTVAERNAIADRDTARDGMLEEAEYEAVKAVCRVMETRASIGMALLKAYGKAGGS